MEWMTISVGGKLVLMCRPCFTKGQADTPSIATTDNTTRIRHNCVAAANDPTWTALGLNDRQIHFMKDRQLRCTKLKDQSDHNVQMGIPDTKVQPRQNMHASASTSTIGASRDIRVTNEDTTGRRRPPFTPLMPGSKVPR